MWDRTRILALLSLGALLLCAASQADARIGDPFRTARHDGFLNFFRFDTASHVVNGEIVTRPWSKQYAGKVELHLTLGADSIVTSVEIRLDSEFIDSDWVTARDIAKNFVRSEIRPEDDSLINDLANEIEYVENRGLQYAGGVPNLPVVPTDEYIAFLGTKASATKLLSKSALTITHITRDDNRRWMSMKISLEALTQPRR